MAKVITRATYQMTLEGYDLLEESSFEYAGMIALALGGSSSGGSTIDPSTLAMLTKQSADLNRTNTAGTYGKSSWSIDPKTGRYTQDVALDPSQQDQLDKRNSIAESMLGQAGTNLTDIKNPFGYSSDVSAPARASFDAASARLMPQFDQQNRNFDQSMYNSGIPMGSEAYNKAERDLSQGQTDQLNSAATGSANTQNTMDLSQRQQRFSDLANMLSTQNTAQPTAGTAAAVDTTGNFNTLNNNVSSMFNNAASKQASGTSALLGLLAAFL